MKNYKIEICEEMKEILTVPIATIRTEERTSYMYDLELLGKHLSECKFCQRKFLVFYDDLELPLFLRSIVDSLIKNLIKK